MSFGFANNLRDALPNASFIGLTPSLPPLGRASPNAPHCLCRSAPSLQSPGETARYLLPRYSSRPVETFGLLALDARHRLRREAVVSVGCLTASLVHPREVFQEAVVSRAAALVLFHNHPSGDPEPSAEDLALTRRLAAAGSLMGIEVLDHLVLGAGRYVSLKERGVL